MFEIRLICDVAEVPSVAQALLGSVDATSVRRFPTRDGKRARLYITADHRSSHTDCRLCDEDGMTRWLTPDGGQEQRPCTGINAGDLLDLGLMRRDISTPHARWTRTHTESE